MGPPSWGDLLQAAHASSLFGLLDFSSHGSRRREHEKVLPLQRSVSSGGRSKGGLASTHHPFIPYWTQPREVKNFILSQKPLWCLQSPATRPQISCHGVIKRGKSLRSNARNGPRPGKHPCKVLQPSSTPNNAHLQQNEFFCFSLLGHLKGCSGSEATD